jgi:hypothetical protein
MNKTARLKRLSRHLLATTCLTLAGVGEAHATTISETSAPSSDFGNTFGTATNLSTIAALTPATGDTVTGTLTFNDVDWFTFTGEPAGKLFSISVLANRNFGTLIVENSSGTALVNTVNLTTTQNVYEAVVPNDGMLDVGLTFSNSNENPIGYIVNVTSPVAPEPSTFAEIGLGLGLAGVIALRRRRQIRNA